jgi:hypothetical protein
VDQKEYAYSKKKLILVKIYLNNLKSFSYEKDFLKDLDYHKKYFTILEFYYYIHSMLRTDDTAISWQTAPIPTANDRNTWASQVHILKILDNPNLNIGEKVTQILTLLIDSQYYSRSVFGEREITTAETFWFEDKVTWVTWASQLRIEGILRNSLIQDSEKVAQILAILIVPQDIDISTHFCYHKFRGEHNAIVMRNVIILMQLLKRTFKESFTLSEYQEMRIHWKNFSQEELEVLKRAEGFWFLMMTQKGEEYSFTLTRDFLNLLIGYIQQT